MILRSVIFQQPLELLLVRSVDARAEQPLVVGRQQPDIQVEDLDGLLLPRRKDGEPAVKLPQGVGGLRGGRLCLGRDPHRAKEEHQPGCEQSCGSRGDSDCDFSVHNQTTFPEKNTRFCTVILRGKGKNIQNHGQGLNKLPKI